MRARFCFAIAALGVCAVAGPLEASFGFRKLLTIDSARVSGASDHFGFPVLISMQNDPDLQANVACVSGVDIQFRASDASRILPHETESYDPATGSLVAWVRIPRLPPSTDTLIYIYYGDPTLTCSLATPSGVWDPLYTGVWHLAEDPSAVGPQMTDSSINGNHGTSGGAMTATDQVAGKIAGALDFDGVDDLIDAGSATILDDMVPLTVSAWIRPVTAGGSGAGEIVAKYGATSAGRWFLELDNTAPEVNAFEFNRNYSTGSVSRVSNNNLVSYGTWQYVVATWDGSEIGTNMRIFKDGTEVLYQSSTNGTLPADTDAVHPFIIGNRLTGINAFDGIIDEVRVSRFIRSDDWIQTEFNNQDNPTKDAACTNAGFVCVGVPQVVPGLFTNVSLASGLNTGGVKDGGVSWGDFNNDTCLDVLVNSNDAAVGTRLYMQNRTVSCDGTFTDVTVCLAPGLANVRERTVIWGDINNDGFLDFARNSPGDIEIYLNNGAGASGCGVAWSVFGSAGAPSQVLDASSIPYAFNAEGLGWMDYDADGDLDLMSDMDGGIAIFDNVGGTLTYVAAPGLPSTQAGSSDYTAVADVDVDGDVDILDRHAQQPDLYLNDANAGSFTVATFDETASNGNKGGVALCDLDDDGDFDIVWTDAGTNQVWEQTGVGSGAFAARGVPGGILGNIDGVACGDVDNDGDLDLMLTSDGQDELFRNDGAFAFTDISPANFGIDDGEGTAFADYDQDGDVDLLINQGTANELWQNNTDNNNYLVLRALDDLGAADRDAIGATIRLLDCGFAPVTGVREVNGGRGHGSQDPAYVHLGLPRGGAPSGPNTQYVAEVRFLDGAVVRKAVTPAGIPGYQLLSVRNTDTDDLTACTTAVSLVALDAVAGDGSISVQWETGSEVNNLGFRLYRATSSSGPFALVTENLVPGLGSSPSGARYRYLDEGLDNGARYCYELEDVETTGAVEKHGPVCATPMAGATIDDPVPRAVTPPPVGAVALPARITVGNPSKTSVRLRRRGRRVLDVELSLGGFYATPLDDGSVRIEVPGWFTPDDAFPLPVPRRWLMALADGSAELVSVRARGVEALNGLRPKSWGAGEAVMDPSGTVRVGRKSFRAPGLVPSEAGRIVSEVVQSGVKRVLLELAPLRWDPQNQRLLVARTLRARIRFKGKIVSRDETMRRPVARTSQKRRRVVAQLSTTERGVHTVGFEEIFPGRRRGVSTSRLRLSRQGVSVPYHVEPNRRRFARGSTLYFLSDGPDANPYGREAVYELELGVPGTRMDIVSSAGAGETPDFVWRRVRGEENRLYLATLLAAEDPWLWDAVFSNARKSFRFDVKGLAPAKSPAHLSLFLQGGTDYPASPDHHVRAWVNGVMVGEERWNAKRPGAIEADIPLGVLREGGNLLEVENVGDTEAAFSLVLVDRFFLEYPGLVQADAGILEGRFDGPGRAVVSNLDARSLVLDVSSGGPRWVKPDGSGALSFDVEANRRYLAVSRDAVRRARATIPAISGLERTSNQADYLMIGSREFLEGARALQLHREAQGIAVEAVALEDIYREFGFGESTPEAIHSFLSYAFHHWQRPAPRYVLLLGDGTYDFKNFLGTGFEHQRLPPFLVKTRFMWTASDPSYAAVDGEDSIPDMAVGRLPAASATELSVMVDKILAYETSDAVGLGGPLVLVADDPDLAGDFESDAEATARNILGGRDVRKLYLRDLGPEETRARIQESFDAGISILSYIGHGGIHLWADETILRSSSIASFAPQPQQPIVLTMNCLNGYFQFPFFDSLSEALVKARDKGAIATFSPSGLSLHGPASRFHEALMRELVSGQHVRLGDAVLAGQSAFVASGTLPELVSIYHLFGDPALVIGER